MGTMAKFIGRLVKRFGRAREGNVALMAGIALPILLMVSAGAIDLHNVARVKTELQDALDAAALAAARSSAVNASEIQSIGMASLQANMPKYFQGNPGDVATFTITGREQVTATATVQVKTIVANIFLPPYGSLFDDYIPMSATSDVLRASRNVEVAMALDVTGSMEGWKLTALQDAAKELVRIVIQGNQTVYTTRVALVPYAAGVNAGSYADALRGPLRGAVNVTAIDVWADTAKTISRVESGLFTSTRHGLAVGDVVFLSGFSGNSGVNNTARTVSSVPSSSTFRLSGLTGSYSAGNNVNRMVRKCSFVDCNSRITANGHGLQTNDYVRLSSLGSAMSALAGNYRVTRVDDNRYLIPATPAISSGVYSATSGGKSQCGADGCATRVFVNMNNNVNDLPGSTCVSERPRGNNAPSNAAPGPGRWLGRAYLENANPCPEPTFLPLSNVTKTVEDSIDDYEAGGSTAGQVGIEMAWYAISPEFEDAFPSASAPNAFDSSRTVKAVVLMTDGEFNTPFCEGVVARNAGTGSGNNSAKINCNATNGDGFKQSVELCRAIKAEGAVVYTVGFGLSTSTGGFGVDTAYEVMQTCATSAEHFFPASSAVELKEAFKSIGRDITRLRIAR